MPRQRAGRKRHDRVCLSHGDTMVALIRRLARAGITLDVACDAQHLGRKRRTVQAYCRKAKIAFVDYRPRCMKQAVKKRVR